MSRLRPAGMSRTTAETTSESGRAKCRKEKKVERRGVDMAEKSAMSNMGGAMFFQERRGKKKKIKEEKNKIP